MRERNVCPWTLIKKAEKANVKAVIGWRKGVGRAILLSFHAASTSL